MKQQEAPGRRSNNTWMDAAAKKPESEGDNTHEGA